MQSFAMLTKRSSNSKVYSFKRNNPKNLHITTSSSVYSNMRSCEEKAASWLAAATVTCNHLITWSYPGFDLWNCCRGGRVPAHGSLPACSPLPQSTFPSI